MTNTFNPGLTPSYSCHVFAAEDLTVTAGACEGDPLCSFAEVCPGDIYMLNPGADPVHLAVRDRDAASHCGDRFMACSAHGHSIATGSELGHPGDAVTLDARYTFMSAEGDTVEILLLSFAPRPGPRPASLHFLPLAPVAPGIAYTLIRTDADPGHVRLSDITSVAFTRGTRITLAGGEQRAVEYLMPGDCVLTRDHGAQPLRWVGRRRERAIGPYAPVVISKGLLGNAADLIVSQHQRIFIYQRGPDRVTPTAEALVKAKYLVNDETVFIRNGGYAEYFHLVFDRHEIIYAECIPTESLLVNERTLSSLPEEMAGEVAHTLPRPCHRPHAGTEASREMLSRIGVNTVLGRAPRRREPDRHDG
ncbi:hypothetical protein DDZ14_01795 [Maritimibacter sp. 55A14]|uniref:Hint domain-containing protein n=1 Tax=Maritimibacter sp. 55A14 TaxID=2174844 RepID=UPI000D60CBE4|nr:Hint domain-containing protein [Maritimibacter sp. 55A14]PWE33926.1 hypothetical protein DDZ14_01795 [Maritimibacter sp. 55A14]